MTWKPSDLPAWRGADGQISRRQLLLLQKDLAASTKGMPFGFIADASVTANQTVTAAGPTDLTGLSVTFTAAANRRYKVTAHVDFASVEEGDQWTGLFRQGSTVLGRWMRIRGGVPSGTGTDGAVFDGSIVVAPSAGSVTYKLSVERVSGSGGATLTAAATNPAYLLVEDIGPA